MSGRERATNQMAIKQKWAVYSRGYLLTEDAEDNVEHDWTLQGETWAVSEEKAINNVRYRKGYSSQYMPVAVGGHWSRFVQWRAERI